MRRTPLRKTLRKEVPGRLKDHEFYLRIWRKSKRRCCVTGKYLGDEPLTVYFHHLLPKAKYPEYRHCEWNIVIVSFDIHNQIETNIDKVPQIKEKTEYLLEQHREGKLQSCTV